MARYEDVFILKDKVSDKLQGYEFWFAGEDQMGFVKYVN